MDRIRPGLLGGAAVVAAPDSRSVLCVSFAMGRVSNVDGGRSVRQSMSERAQALTGVGADDLREMALIDESKIRRDSGQILLSVRETFECARDAYSIPE